ncbi:hypothetical protein VCRA2110O182_40073 [Vibrio crassostreae]|nr:hypothetical protein VCRA2110O182_40073 [Vibrio crassostreae]CAK2343210.1 hypothetical protein VCRA2111O408_40073 [Vibrio crassostreae]CAK2356530.1 hypothetical protein VCRA211O406_30268 [Vibrio crassostreae]
MRQKIVTSNLKVNNGKKCFNSWSYIASHSGLHTPSNSCLSLLSFN